MHGFFNADSMPSVGNVTKEFVGQFVVVDDCHGSSLFKCALNIDPDAFRAPYKPV